MSGITWNDNTEMNKFLCNNPGVISTVYIYLHNNNSQGKRTIGADE